MEFLTKTDNQLKVYQKIIYSSLLDREVTVDFYLPAKVSTKHNILFLNDGQDGKVLKLLETLNRLLANKKIKPLMVVAIHANQNRLHEYGTANHLDYLKRGSLAAHFKKAAQSSA